jgi:hypothetical protein
VDKLPRRRNPPGVNTCPQGRLRKPSEAILARLGGNEEPRRGQTREGICLLPTTPAGGKYLPPGAGALTRGGLRTGATPVDKLP